MVSEITNSSARIQVLITYLLLCYFYHTHTISRTSPGSRLRKAKSKVTLSELCGLDSIKGTTIAVDYHLKMTGHAYPSLNNLVSEKYLYYKKAPFTSTLKTCKVSKWSGTNKAAEGRDAEINLPPRQRSICHHFVEAIESSEAAERLFNVCDHIWLYHLHLVGIRDKITPCIPADITPGWLAKATPRVLQLPAPDMHQRGVMGPKGSHPNNSMLPASPSHQEELTLLLTTGQHLQL